MLSKAAKQKVFIGAGNVINFSFFSGRNIYSYTPILFIGEDQQSIFRQDTGILD